MEAELTTTRNGGKEGNSVLRIIRYGSCGKCRQSEIEVLRTQGVEEGPESGGLYGDTVGGEG